MHPAGSVLSGLDRGSCDPSAAVTPYVAPMILVFAAVDVTPDRKARPANSTRGLSACN